MIDLHVHTNASDGIYSPTRVVAMAHAAELSAVAITDHDTLDGIDEAVEAARELPLETVPGVELSVNHGSSHFHLLGYFTNPDDPELRDAITRVQEARKNRNPQIIERLQELGVDITMEEVTDISDGGQVGRPHFAKVLQRKGYIKSFQEAFERYLGVGAPAYVDKARITAEEGISLLRKAGGVPVGAHFGLLPGSGSNSLEDHVRELSEMGLMGLEVFYSKHNPSSINRLLRIVEQEGLLITGGTDFHGTDPAIRLGVGFGKLRVDDSLLLPLKAAHEQLIQR